MFGNYASDFFRNTIRRSAENASDCWRFARAASGLGLGLGLGVAGIGALASLKTATGEPVGSTGDGAAPSDSAILNFALTLEYLEAEFYLRAVTGEGLDDSQVDGRGVLGPVSGGHKVDFESKLAGQFAAEIAADERAHVAFFREALGSARVARPAIDLDQAFSAAATAAGLIAPGQTFDPFADEDSFLLGAFLFEDVGVTAFKGAAPLITNKTYLEAAAGILAVEAYHAGLVRSVLLSKGLADQANRISQARDSLGPGGIDQGIVDASGNANVVPADSHGVAFSRSPGQVLNVVYLNSASVDRGGFYPAGVNGEVNTSAQSS
jgi:hypothetical protein